MEPILTHASANKNRKKENFRFQPSLLCVSTTPLLVLDIRQPIGLVHIVNSPICCTPPKDREAKASVEYISLLPFFPFVPASRCLPPELECSPERYGKEERLQYAI